MPGTFLDYITLGMGNAKSKPKDRYGRTKKATARKSNGDVNDQRTSDGAGSRDPTLDIRERFADDEELKNLKDDIQYRPEIFVLNNLMMSVQFFENFDEEIANIRKTSPRETELNDRLPSQKQVLIPDALQQHLAQKIAFTCVNPRRELTIELLHPTRIYVAFDNIEVTEENYASPYSTLKGIVTYSMHLKRSPKHEGYVLLERLDVNPTKKTMSLDNLSSISTNRKTEFYSDNDSAYGAKSHIDDPHQSTSRSTENIFNSTDIDEIYGIGPSKTEKPYFPHPSTSRNDPTPRAQTPQKPHRTDRKFENAKFNTNKMHYWQTTNFSTAESTSSGYRSELYNNSDSDYPRTTCNNTPKTSKSSLSDYSQISTTEIPRQCFRTIEYDINNRIWNPRNEKKYKQNTTDWIIHQAQKTQNYKIIYLNSAKFVKYFCLLFENHLSEPMGFESTGTREIPQSGSIIRTIGQSVRGTKITKIERFEIVPCVRYQQWPECAQEWLNRSRNSWPSYGIVEEVRDFGCHLIPDGFTDDKSGPYRNLEWQLIFPAAERYLETCLTHAQIRVYIVALMLRKTFMRPVDSLFGLTVSHIRHKLFWLVEEDASPFAWMENRTGEALVKLLTSIYRAISQDVPRLSDYFVREKNLFHEKSHLFMTQKQIKRITENPIMYVFHAMENIRYYGKNFPSLNFGELYGLLTNDELVLANPALAGQTTGRQQFARNEGDEDGRQGSEGIGASARKPVTKKNMIDPRLANNQIVEITVRCGKMEPTRLSRLLDFFIRRFIKMAECCHDYRAQSQKLVYVDQAERLSVLLMDYSSHKTVAMVYYEKLQSLRKLVPRTKTQNSAPVTTLPDPPETPKRNPNSAIFARPMNYRFATSDDVEDREKIVGPSEVATTSVSGVKSTISKIRDEKSVVDAKIDEEKAKTMEIRENTESTKIDEDDEIDRSTEKLKRVVSIVKAKNESFLTETTHI